MFVNEPSWNSFTMSTKWTSAVLGISPNSAISSAAARSDSDRRTATAPVFAAAPLNPMIFMYASQRRIGGKSEGRRVEHTSSHHRDRCSRELRCLWFGFVKAVVLVRRCRPLLSYECQGQSAKNACGASGMGLSSQRSRSRLVGYCDGAGHVLPIAGPGATSAPPSSGVFLWVGRSPASRILRPDFRALLNVPAFR